VTRVSVIVPSYRDGGLDILCDSLAGQAFRDFELVITDAIYDRRRPIVADRLASYDFPIKHISPTGGPALSNYCRSINDAFAHASGELVVIQCDYTWMPPDCLAEHWRAYEESDKRTCFLRDNHCTALPPLHPEFTPYGPDMEQFTEGRRAQIEAEINAGADRYAADLEAGKLDRFMWSIFAEPLTQATVDALPVTRSDVKQGRPQIDYRHCSLKNEGIPLEAFLAVNGLDEDFDGSHLYQDQEFAWRVERAGYRWATTSGADVKIVNPRTVLSSKRLDRPMDTNGKLMYAKQAAGIVRVNEHRDLRVERASTVAT
jgi:glycosyltransferase involved in cell wall biosynthesis